MARPRKRSLADVVLPEPGEDGHIYLTGALAAQVAQTTPRTIRAWREAGWLPAAGQEPGGRRQFVYRYADVIVADARARRIAA